MGGGGREGGATTHHGGPPSADDVGPRFEAAAVHDAGEGEGEGRHVECQEDAQVHQQHRRLQPWEGNESVGKQRVSRNDGRSDRRAVRTTQADQQFLGRVPPEWFYVGILDPIEAVHSQGTRLDRLTGSLCADHVTGDEPAQGRHGCQSSYMQERPCGLRNKQSQVKYNFHVSLQGTNT